MEPVWKPRDHLAALEEVVQVDFVLSGRNIDRTNFLFGVYKLVLLGGPSTGYQFSGPALQGA